MASKSSLLYVLLPYIWWQMDDYFFGYARVAGMTFHFSMSPLDSEEAYTDTKFVLLAFTWLLILWRTVDIRKLLIVTTTAQTVLVLAQAFVPSTRFLLTVRSALGIGGAVFSGSLILMAEHSVNHVATGAAVFVAVPPLTISVLGGVLSAVVRTHKKETGLMWPAVLYIDGVLGLLVAFTLWLRLPSLPSRGWSSPASRASHNNHKDDNERGWKNEILGVFNLTTFLCIAIFTCASLAGAASPSYLSVHFHQTFAHMPYFLFSILADLSSSHVIFNSLVAAPYLASILSVFLTARMSDRLRVRGYFVGFHMLLSGLGFAYLALAAQLAWNQWWSFLAMFPACLGFVSAMAITIAWALDNTNSVYQRAFVLTMLLSTGQLVTLFSPAGIKPYWRAVDEPAHVRGLILSSALMISGSILALLLRTYLVKYSNGDNINNTTEKHLYQPVGLESLLSDTDEIDEQCTV